MWFRGVLDTLWWLGNNSIHHQAAGSNLNSGSTPWSPTGNCNTLDSLRPGRPYNKLINQKIELEHTTDKATLPYLRTVLIAYFERVPYQRRLIHTNVFLLQVFPKHPFYSKGPLLSTISIYSMIINEKHSIDHTVIQLVDEIINSFGKNLFTLRVFMDLPNTFDAVNHLILIRKLGHYSVKGRNHLWFKSYSNHSRQLQQAIIKICFLLISCKGSLKDQYWALYFYFVT